MERPPDANQAVSGSDPLTSVREVPSSYTGWDTDCADCVTSGKCRDTVSTLAVATCRSVCTVSIVSS